MIERLVKAAESAEHCQRNWNYSQPVSEEHVNDLIKIATSMPTKQNSEYFLLVVSTNREINEKFYNVSVDPKNRGTVNRNSQVNSPVVFTWFDASIANEYQNKQGFYDSEILNLRTAVGISSGAVSLAANLLGYKTGFNQCFSHKDIHKILKTELKEFDESLFKRAHLQVGIGCPDNNHSWNTILNNDGSVLKKLKTYKKNIKVFRV